MIVKEKEFVIQEFVKVFQDAGQINDKLKKQPHAIIVKIVKEIDIVIIIVKLI